MLGSDIESVFSLDDPLPGLAELTLLPYLYFKRGSSMLTYLLIGILLAWATVLPLAWKWELGLARASLFTLAAGARPSPGSAASSACPASSSPCSSGP